MSPPVRTRRDLCPGVLRPWHAEDGDLVRIRLCGGLLSAAQLAGLRSLAASYGDGNVHLTKRANVQIRAVSDNAALAEDLERLGLLPSRTHELVRNIVVSPLGDLHALAARFDALLCADRELAVLPARFLFSFDDRDDLGSLEPDLGVLVGDDARLVVGGRVGQRVRLDDVPERLVELAHRFLALRGEGPEAAWHVRELPDGVVSTDAPSASASVAARPAAPADPPGIAVADGILTPAFALPRHETAIVTPWRGLVLR